MRFTGKTVLVTGAASGIGYEICRQFALEGATVGLSSRNPKTTAEAADKINAELGRKAVLPYPCDVGDCGGIVALVHRFAAEQGGLDIYMANAGITSFAPFLEEIQESFDGLMAVNMKGTYFSTQAAAKEMIARKTKGRIILMSSVTGFQSHRNLSAYAMTKAATRMLAKNLADELGCYGITVNVVAPGATTSERTVTDPQYCDGWSAVSPACRVGDCEDVAHSVLFLADPKSRHITGEVIMIDGGWTITSPLPEHLQRELGSQGVRE